LHGIHWSFIKIYSGVKENSFGSLLSYLCTTGRYDLSTLSLILNIPANQNQKRNFIPKAISIRGMQSSNHIQYIYISLQQSCTVYSQFFTMHLPHRQIFSGFLSTLYLCFWRLLTEFGIHVQDTQRCIWQIEM